MFNNLAAMEKLFPYLRDFFFLVKNSDIFEDNTYKLFKNNYSVFTMH